MKMSDIDNKFILITSSNGFYGVCIKYMHEIKNGIIERLTDYFSCDIDKLRYSCNGFYYNELNMYRKNFICKNNYYKECQSLKSECIKYDDKLYYARHLNR